MFHNALVVDSSIRKPGKSSKTVKRRGDLHGCPTRGVGRTRTMFHNTLVVGSSPTSSTTQSPTTGEIVIQFEMPSMVAAQLRAAPSQPRGGLEAWQEGEELAENGRNH